MASRGRQNPRTVGAEGDWNQVRQVVQQIDGWLEVYVDIRNWPIGFYFRRCGEDFFNRCAYRKLYRVVQRALQNHQTVTCVNRLDTTMKSVMKYAPVVKKLVRIKVSGDQIVYVHRFQHDHDAEWIDWNFRNRNQQARIHSTVEIFKKPVLDKDDEGAGRAFDRGFRRGCDVQGVPPAA